MKEIVSYFDEMAPIWDEAVIRNAEKLRHFMTLAGVRQGDEVLDVGGGTGALIPYIRENNVAGQITEVDISRRMLNMARAKFHNDTDIRYLNENIEEYSEGREYDRIFMYGVLPHLADKVGTIVRKINKLHSHGDKRVADAYLPPMREFISDCEKQGLKAVFSEDTDRDYTILFK